MTERDWENAGHALGKVDWLLPTIHYRYIFIFIIIIIIIIIIINIIIIIIIYTTIHMTSSYSIILLENDTFWYSFRPNIVPDHS